MRRDSPAASKIATMRPELKSIRESRQSFGANTNLCAQREIIANTSATLTNYLRHNRNCNFLGSLAPISSPSGA